METIVKRSSKDNEEMLSMLKGHLSDTNYDYECIFTGNGNDFPYWGGYSLGYYIVKKCLKKSDKTIEEAFADKYVDIEAVL